MMEAAARDRYRRNRVLKYQLLQVTRLEHQRKLVETTNLAREFDAAHQVDRYIDTVFTKVVEKPILNVLGVLCISVHFLNRLSLF